MKYTEENLMIRDMAREFATRELAPNAAEWDKNASFPREALKEMGELGLLGMLVPEQFGGAATDNVAYSMALEEIAAGDGACSTIMSVHNSVACLPILRYGSDDQKQEYLTTLASGEKLGAFCLTEPQAGSDASAISTRAEMSGCLLYTSPSPRDQRGSRMPSSA